MEQKVVEHLKSLNLGLDQIEIEGFEETKEKHDL